MCTVGFSCFRCNRNDELFHNFPMVILFHCHVNVYPNSAREVGQSYDLKVAIVELAVMSYHVKSVCFAQPR